MMYNAFRWSARLHKIKDFRINARLNRRQLMSMTSYDSRPRSDLLGIKDESIRVPILEDIVLPAHLPFTPLFTEKGDGLPHLVRSGSARLMYGDKTFDTLSKYFTHQTLYANLFMGNGNPTMIMRLIPEDARTAMFRLYVEAITTVIPKYERDSSGHVKYRYNELNEREPIVSGEITGTRLVFHVNLNPGGGTTPLSANEFKLAEVIEDYRAGSEMFGPVGNKKPLGQVGPNFTSSTLYPIFDFTVSSVGEHGLRKAIRFGLPTTRSSSPIDLSSFYSTKSYIGRIGVARRSDDLAWWNGVENNYGMEMMDFSFKPNARTARSKDQLNLEPVWLNSFEQVDLSKPTVLPEFDKVHVYQDSIEALLNRIVDGTHDNEAEIDYNNQRELGGSLPVGTGDELFLLNFLGGYDENGVRYHTFETDTSAFYGGVSLSDGATFAASGGDDGLTMKADGTPDEAANYQLYDEMVRNLMDEFKDSILMNRLKYPISAVWDSGFSIQTKKSLVQPIAHRKDVATILATHSIYDYTQGVEISCAGATNTSGDIELEGVFDLYINGVLVEENINADDIPEILTANMIPPGSGNGVTLVRRFAKMSDNNQQEEISIAGMLRQWCLDYPESEVYGTATCRAIVVGQSGRLINNPYTHRVPLTYEIADKVSKFMGNPSGYWNGDFAYDMGINKIISNLRDVSNVWKKETVANLAWANGLVYAIDYDMRRLFFPAVRTVYNNDTSVLNGSITMFACCLIERFCDEAWRELVGNGKWRPNKFLQESDRILMEKLSNRFDDRFLFEVNTYYTQADAILGYRWSTNVIIYAPNMKLVGRYTIIARRIEDYQEPA